MDAAGRAPRAPDRRARGVRGGDHRGQAAADRWMARAEDRAPAGAHQRGDEGPRLTTTIAPSARVLDNVRLGQDSVVQDFCLLGQSPAETAAAELVIGEHALIRSHTTLYSGSRIGAWFQTGHGVVVRQGCSFGDHCSVGSGSVVEFSVTLGSRVRLHSQCFVPEHSILEDGCWLGPRVVLTNARYPASPSTKKNLEGVRVATNAKVGP